MPWSWVRPTEGGLLDRRPLLDLGCGDGQTLRWLMGSEGPAVGLDRSLVSLRAARRGGLSSLVCASATDLPLRDRLFRVVLAADLFHHLCDDDLDRTATEISRVLASGGQLVAWWYATAPAPERRASGAPRYARTLEEVAGRLERVGMTTRPLSFEHALDPAPPTAALVGLA